MKRKEKLRDFFQQKAESLNKSLGERKEDLRQMKFGLISGKVKNIRQIREARRDIARIKTLLSLKLKEDSLREGAKEQK